MTQPQRKRAMRLRAKLDAGKALTPREDTWLSWYDVNAVPVVGTASVVDSPEVKPEVEPATTPEPPAPRYGTIEASASHAATPGTVERLTVGDCSEESMRSAVNVQIAAGQMIERAAQLAIDHAAQMSGQVGDLVAQLVDAMTSLVEVQYARGRERVEAAAERAQETPEAQTSAVTEELARKMIDGVFPSLQKSEPKTP